MNLNDLTKQEYLGDGVYIGFYGNEIWLITHDGIKTTNAICLEPLVASNLRRYLEK